MPLPAGSRFGRYVIEGLLGKGGMGQVYRARDTLLRRQVALKILRAFTEAGDRDSGRTAAKILREARVAAAFQHPNAVAIYDLGEHKGQHFLAMELVSGRSMRELVGKPEVSIEQRVRWLADIARALDAAHRAGIMHLDVKPDNVMVSADGLVKVLDFGIARRFMLDRDVMSSTSTATATAAGMRSAFVGTPRYMAPEQVRRTALDGRTDQFSWGVLAYELLTGRTPWQQRDSLFDLLSAIVHEPPPVLRDANAEVPEALSAVVMRALSKQADERFPAMGELVAALECAYPLAPSGRSPSMPSLTPPSERSKISERAHSVKPWMEAKTLSHSADDPVGSLSPQASLAALDSAPLPLDTLASADESSDGASRRSGTTDSLETAQKTLPRMGRGRRRSWLLASLLLGAALAVMWGVRSWLAASSDRASVAPAPAPSNSAPVAPVPTTLLDLPPPAGCNPEGTTQFRAGIHAQHDGNWERAAAFYEAAARADPECAAAHLRLTIAAYPTFPAAQTREFYQRAIQLRASLNERDRQLLDALDPLVRRDPSDAAAFTARMRTIAEQFPGDAEIVFLSGENEADFDAQHARARAAIALDPRYSDAWQLIASAYKHQHKIDEARAALDECLRLAPNSVDCVRERIDLDRTSGQCDEMVTHAQLWVARAPKSAEGYLGLACALAAHGAPAGTIEEALRQRWARLTAEERPRAQAMEQALLDALTGRFDHAAERAREVSRLLEADPSYEPRVGPTLLLANASVETNQIDKAAELAADFLGRKDAWSRSLRRGNPAMKSFHIEPLLLDIQYKARKLPASSWQMARAVWVQSTRHTRRLSEETIWAIGTAMPAQTAAQAAEALRSMPESLKANHWALRPEVLPAAAFAGRALLLAGRIDEALVFLRRAVTHCDALAIPFEDTQANLWLGQALEKKGDTAGACTAYQVVARRWGNAKPPSVTAAIAKERSRSLRCAD